MTEMKYFAVINNRTS